MHTTDPNIAVELRRLIACGTTEHRLVKRANIVLARIFAGRSVSSTARTCGASRPTVRKWCSRFRASWSLVALEDAKRSGRPKTISPRDEAVVITLGCQRPGDVDRLDAQMTQSLIAELAIEQGTILSRSSVQRILAGAEVQPHRERYYLFTTKDHPEYIPRRDAICDLYMASLPSDEVVICFDEKTGIQALGTPHPGKPTAPGKVALKEHNYIRHGTRNLVAAIRPDTGEVVTAELFPFRGYATEEAITMLQSLLMLLPGMRVIHLVWDNASTHCSARMREFLASEEGQRFRLYYTPTHASWLNLAENFFSRFSRRYLKGRRYESLVALDELLYDALNDYNARHAKALRWSYNPGRAAA